MAGTGPMPITRGATPATAPATYRARGVNPCSFTAVFRREQQRACAVVDARRVARGHRAVRLHDRLELGERLERRVGARMLVDRRPRPSPCAAEPRPARSLPRAGRCAAAAAARCWLRYANASWSARATRHSSATCSAVSGIASVPYACCIFGLMNRQPSVVSSSFRPRANAASALPIDERRARHALDAAGDDERHLAAADRARRLHDGIEARPAQPVHRRSRHLLAAARRAAAPCGRRCGCPRPPDSRTRRSRRRRAIRRGWDSASRSAAMGMAARSSVRTLASAPP